MCLITGFDEKMNDKVKTAEMLENGKVKTPNEMTDDEFLQYARENRGNKEFRNNREYGYRLASLWRRFL